MRTGRTAWMAAQTRSGAAARIAAAAAAGRVSTNTPARPARGRATGAPAATSVLTQTPKWRPLTRQASSAARVPGRSPWIAKNGASSVRVCMVSPTAPIDSHENPATARPTHPASGTRADSQACACSRSPTGTQKITVVWALVHTYRGTQGSASKVAPARRLAGRGPGETRPPSPPPCRGSPLPRAVPAGAPAATRPARAGQTGRRLPGPGTSRRPRSAAGRRARRAL
jgi:hypothetical protein